MKMNPIDHPDGRHAAVAVSEEREHVKFRLLVPLAGAIAVLLSVFNFAFHQQQRQRTTQDISRSSREVEKLLGAEQKKKTSTMATLLQAIQNDEQTAKAFERADRVALLARTLPLHEALKKEHRITHLYFHATNRVNLLRVHRPDQRGDTINRHTIKEAERTGQMSSGIERGPVGTFVLRVVSPWRHEGRLLGYVELGMEFEDLLKELHGLLAVDFVAAVDKKFLDRDQWNKALKSYGREASWDQFPDAVVMDKTVATIPDTVVKHLSSRSGQGQGIDHVETLEGRSSQLVFLPLNDVSGKTLGELIILRDITALVEQAGRSVRLVAFICLGIGGILLVGFYVHLLRVENDLTERRIKLKTEVLERQRAEAQLREAHEGLERRVQERTAELQKANTDLGREIAIREKAQREHEATHRQLVEASRLAGMAEVATSVLHNVGNVLNSVNVSATLVADKVKKSKSASLAKLAALVREHKADLGAFLTSDPKGRQVPTFLDTLAENLGAERAAMIEELAGLQKNIEHIKDVVAMQQTYGKASGVMETLPVGELIEDALRMNASSLTRHDIEVVREFAAVPPVTVDKHKLLQILVNLVRNAKHACDDSGRTDKRIILRVACDATCVRISVSDNGVGIPAENLTRIFNHGFTTKKDGHGFGLHSSANAAREMDGSLTVHSDGTGLGATFTVELPMESAKRLAA